MEKRSAKVMCYRKSTGIPVTLVAWIFLMDVVVGAAIRPTNFLPPIQSSNTLVDRSSDATANAERRSLIRESEREDDSLFLNTLWSIIVIGRQRSSLKSPHRNSSNSAVRNRHRQQTVTRYDHNCFFSPMNCVLWQRQHHYDTATTTATVDSNNLDVFLPKLIPLGKGQTQY